jgi:hypothetical protein
MNYGLPVLENRHRPELEDDELLLVESGSALLEYDWTIPAPRRPLARPSFDLQKQRDKFALAMCVGLWQRPISTDCAPSPLKS